MHAAKVGNGQLNVAHEARRLLTGLNKRRAECLDPATVRKSQ